ncbi:hypothetical protein [Paraburkholderia sp. Cy-641]|uniref:hypothetical protein n=1 Tax=Paraburkholderia sp. Cy-641 TaxID=2608337 RepID=UPI001F036EDE|nr:hypothetical protein [Paraburkholderia sp. Cy-641]
MDTVSSSRNTAAVPLTGKTGFIERIRRVNRLFLLTVVVPTTVAVGYFGLIASDVYVSESRFVVRSPQRQTSQSGLVGALLQGTGFSRATDDTYPVIDYIQSRDALSLLNRDDYIQKVFGRHNGDIFTRFPGIDRDRSFESLWKYYQKRVVEVDFDSTSSITTLKVHAFSAEDAQRINAELLSMSEQLINRMNERAADDAVQFAQREVDQAAAKAKDAALALASYRNNHTVFDPDKESAQQLIQLSGLHQQLYAAQNQLTVLEAIAPANPQIGALKANITSLQRQISDAESGVVGGKGSLSDKASSYARLQLDVQFADKQLASTMTALETARAEAQRKQLYLERLVEPNDPDIAIEPHRLKDILEVFALGMIVWGILTLLVAGLHEHKD